MVGLLAAALAMVAAVAGPARADGGVAMGVVMKLGPAGEKSYMGARAGLEGDVFGLGFERYQGSEATRTRCELMFHLSLPIGRGVSVEPGVGFMPLDYISAFTGETIWTMSATAGLRVRAPFFGPIELQLEPVRLEERLLRVTARSGLLGGIPTWSRESALEFSSVVGLTAGW